LQALRLGHEPKVRVAIEEFFVRFPNCFLAHRWKSIITGYLTNMDAAPVALEVVIPSPIESAVTLARAPSNNNVTSMSMLQAHDV